MEKTHILALKNPIVSVCCFVPPGWVFNPQSCEPSSLKVIFSFTKNRVNQHHKAYSENRCPSRDHLMLKAWTNLSKILDMMVQNSKQSKVRIFLKVTNYLMTSLFKYRYVLLNDF